MDLGGTNRPHALGNHSPCHAVYRVARLGDGVPARCGSCAMTPNRKLTFCALLCSTSLLSGCNETAPDPRTQIGAKPDRPRSNNIFYCPCMWRQSSAGRMESGPAFRTI